MEDYNRQASDYIFRENNAQGRVADDTIDLHGQFVEEAERILETRIQAAKQQGQTHLHVIVGKGNHSPDHIQKIKPRVEQICQQEGLQYYTEANAGRMYINLQGGAAIPPPNTGYDGYHGGGQQQHGGQQYGGGQQQHGGQQYGGQQQQGGEYDEIEALARKEGPKLLKKLFRACCTVM
jgi:Smr domain